VLPSIVITLFEMGVVESTKQNRDTVAVKVSVPTLEVKACVVSVPLENLPIIVTVCSLLLLRSMTHQSVISFMIPSGDSPVIVAIRKSPALLTGTLQVTVPALLVPLAVWVSTQ
jgi:hypothetical protein